MASLTAQEFVAKWSKSTLKESSASQEHFIDLCRLVGHPTPAEGKEGRPGHQGMQAVWSRLFPGGQGSGQPLLFQEVRGGNRMTLTTVPSLFRSSPEEVRVSMCGGLIQLGAWGPPPAASPPLRRFGHLVPGLF